MEDSGAISNMVGSDGQAGVISAKKVYDIDEGGGLSTKGGIPSI
jgi:hypothetical protein